MASLYVFAGVNHFVKPAFYLKITPKWVPAPKTINYFVGLIEILLGIGLLLGSTRQFSAAGIIILLVAVFPANVYHFQRALKKKKHVLPVFIRLPFQGFLIYWAYTFL
ncbi:MAG: DoxX family protein [Saprospiraceae bacterium]|nr:DoxX family protein [Saprospiraceae bacterium]